MARGVGKEGGHPLRRASSWLLWFSDDPASGTRADLLGALGLLLQPRGVGDRHGLLASYRTLNTVWTRGCSDLR